VARQADLSQEAREFEAESVSYLVCARLGIDTAADEYLAAYVRQCPVTLAISLDRVMKSVWLIEQMGRARLGLRKAAMSQMVVPLLISDRAMRAHPTAPTRPEGFDAGRRTLPHPPKETERFWRSHHA
jgi:hypothetical protein